MTLFMMTVMTGLCHVSDGICRLAKRRHDGNLHHSRNRRIDVEAHLVPRKTTRKTQEGETI